METSVKRVNKNKKAKRLKVVFIVGGVMSGVGKGVTASSVALLLQARGLKITAIKIDPYINVDAGTMNPTEHGEVFVLKDGLETDQDMGNYERFLNQDLPSHNYMTTGSVYLSVIEKERNLGYAGKNVEVVPDIPLEVIRRIKKAAKEAKADVVMVEVGGTVGEYQNVLFLEAIRMMKNEAPNDIATIMVSYLPVPGSIGEMKTKPTQTAVRSLNSTGVFADFIVARSPVELDNKRREKIARFCNVKDENVIAAPDVPSIYDIPLYFENQDLSHKLLKQLNIKNHTKVDLLAWKKFVKKNQNAKSVVKIAVIGKYFNSGDFVLADVYLSVLEALKYSAYTQNLKPEITYLSAEDFTTYKHCQKLKKYDGILVPGGFGATGIDGKLNVIRYARENRIPYFGICYGMQLLVIEYARNVAKLKQAHTTEIDPNTPHKVVDVMSNQVELIANKKLGGTMRLGQYVCDLKLGSAVARAYGKQQVNERHRHRYEINPDYVPKLEEAGLVFSGYSSDKKLMEIAELPATEHPFYVGVQFHPEFLARPLSPHPLFTAFIKASYEN